MFFLGYCCIRYRVCDTANSFTLGNQKDDMTQAKVGSDCAAAGTAGTPPTRGAGDFIVIEGRGFMKR